MRGTWLCSRCESATSRFVEPLCLSCGVPEALGACRCAELPDSVERVRSIGAYGGWLRGTVTQVKYHGEWARVSLLGPLLAEACVDLLPADVLVPVPLHPSRRKQRGFNQTEKLAESLSSHVAIPVELALQRSRKTSPQVRLDAAGRQTNVLGAFQLALGSSIAGKRVILIDDVITTGATLGACAEILVAGGASAVSAVTVAREM